ncbi:serine/threonine protein kinase [Candidatus Woesearchaeota archaeon]|nr:serine/threonine protein kinase [Candidatus Woesearchaeota archaeon]
METTRAETKTLEGKCIDGFNVLALQGAGGFSDVYKVEDSLGQIFAMKIVRDKKHAPLLNEEAKILAGLSHAQIPRAVRFGEHEGQPFFVMDYVPKTLQGFIDSGIPTHNWDVFDKNPKGVYPHPASVCLNIAKGILDILKYTHEKGIVHKDLKPKNVGFDKNGKVVIYDFNIAKNITQTAKEAPDLCSVIDSDVVNVGGIQKSVLGGTEGYSSPEQRKMKVDGKIHPVDQRSDIYTVGVMLYELLVGNLPHGNYEKPSVKKPMPQWIDVVVDKAMSQNPDKRYKSAQEMLDDINAGLEGKLDGKNKVAVYVQETMWPTVIDAAKTVGGALWKVVKFPFWVYTFGPSKYFYELEQNTGNDCSVPGVGFGVLTAVLWGLSAYYGLSQYSSLSDKKFVEDFKKNPKGTIVCENDGKICYFSAKDALKPDIKYNETSAPKVHIKNLQFKDDTLYFIASEAGSGHALYSLNVSDGKEKKIFDLGKTLDYLVEKTHTAVPHTHGDATTATTDTAELRVNALKGYDLHNIDAKIYDFSFSKDADKRINLQIGSNWYSVNKDGEDFRKENIAVTTSTKKDLLVCPDSAHYLGNNGGGFVKLEWNSHSLGSYVTPVRGRPKMWLDYEVSENK